MTLPTRLVVVATFVTLTSAAMTDRGVAQITVVSSSPINAGQSSCVPGFPAPQCLVFPYTNAINLAGPGGLALPAVASSSISAMYSAIHRPEYVNDGLYGNGASWIPGGGNSHWIKIDLGQAVVVDAITFGRDRGGNFDDRDPGPFTISTALTDDVYANGNASNDTLEYTTVLSSSSFGFSGSINGPETLQCAFSAVLARYIRIDFMAPGPCIDEIEVFSFANSPPEFQVNQAEATLQINGLMGTAFSPSVTGSASGMIDLASSNIGQPFNVAITHSPALPASSGGTTLSDGQIVNLDLGHTSFSWVFPMFPGPAFPGPASIPYSVCTPSVTTGQMMVVAPGTSLGIALSAPVTLDTLNAGSSLAGPTGDDSFIQVFPGLAPLCGPTTITFAGTVYTDFFVNSNGSVSFGSGSTDPSPTVTEFATEMPRLAGVWTDLHPSLGGSIDITSTAGVITVSFQAVPSFGAGTVFMYHSVDLVFDTNTGSCSIHGLLSDQNHPSATLVGLSPGGVSGTNPAVSFSSLAGAGLQTGNASDIVYEFNPYGPVAGGFSMIEFPNSDPTQWVVY